MAKEKDKERYLRLLDEHLADAKDSSRYAIGRFDILVISVSTTALVFSMSFIKELVPQSGTVLLKLSWILLAATIITNLISQVTSFYSHDLTIKITKNNIRSERGKTIKGDQPRMVCRQRNLDNSTTILNFSSLILLIVGIILLLIFLSKNI